MLALDNSSFFSQLLNQAYPAKPAGLGLSDSIFYASLNPLTPLAVSLIYLLATKLANSRFKGSKNAPRDIIKNNAHLERAVVAHNVFLCLYSAWTSVEVFKIMASYFGNGIREGGLAGFTNAFCTVPVYDPEMGLGRLAVLFYYSKFYEVVDSIILAMKGKPVSNLQSYHHAGAMWSMWAGYRYSAPAIWIFSQFNSTIHAAMYLWYSCSTLKIPVPKAFKQGMTTAQITQLVVGFFIATSYFYLRYDPLAYPSGLAQSAGVPSSYYSNMHNTLLSSSSTSNSSSFFNSSKTLAGLQALPGYSEAKEAIIRSADSNGTVSCIQSSGALFGVVLNSIYLGPLIALFVRFYLRSYQKKSSAKKE